jgi:hypothetical protein
VPSSRKSAGSKRKPVAITGGRDSQGERPAALTGEVVDAALQFLISRGQQRSGQAFLEALTRFLCEALGVTYAFCGKFESESVPAVEMVAFFAHGAVQPNQRYELRHTPCANVVGKALC